jgi:hypothetical protein
VCSAFKARNLLTTNKITKLQNFQEFVEISEVFWSFQEFLEIFKNFKYDSGVLELKTNYINSQES